MNKTIQKLRDLRDKCVECEGRGGKIIVETPSGEIYTYKVKDPDVEKMPELAGERIDCKTCKGTGVNRKLDFGCEIKNNYGTSTYLGLVDEEDRTISIINNDFIKDGVVDCCEDDYGIEGWENLGKPLTLQDVLLMLGKNDIGFSIDTLGYMYIDDGVLKNIIPSDLTKDIEDQPEVIESLIKLLST